MTLLTTAHTLYSALLYSTMDTLKQSYDSATWNAVPDPGKGKRRASAEVRKSQVAKHGAVGVRLIVPRRYCTMPGTLQTLDGDNLQRPALKPESSTRAEFDKVQRKLYRVTRNGCLIPHRNWCLRGQGTTDKGYQLMMDAYYGWRPSGGGHGQGPDLRNSRGWPEVLQASHLCHEGPSCCNPTHVIVEPKWRNVKRNYCGSAGQCDCSLGIVQPWNQFPCIQSYRNVEYDDLPEEDFVTDENDIRNALDNYDCPGFFHSDHADQQNLRNQFVLGTHWEFVGAEELAEVAAADLAVAENLVKRRK